MIDHIDPGPQPGIEVRQIMDAGQIQLCEELLAKSAMPSLQFCFPFRRIGAAIDQMNAQTGADALQALRAIGGSIVNDQFFWQPALQNRLLEHSLDIQRLLAGTEGAVRQ